MKRTLAITAATAMLVLSLAGCGAQRYDGALSGADDTSIGGTTATDTMYNGNGGTGTGTTNGASTNDAGLGGVTGAVNRATRYGSNAANGGASYGSNAYGDGTMVYDSHSTYGVGGPNSSVYTATNNGGMVSNNGTLTGGVDYSDNAAVKRAAAEGDRYARMLENGRVHDRDGYLLDGENASYRTY